MPFCTKCGNEVRPADRFCRRCGHAQPAAAPAAPTPALSPRAAAILCYIPWLGWIASVYVLVGARFADDRRLRFHAFQGLYLFVAWMLAHWALGQWLTLLGARPAAKLVELAVLGVWIFMLIKTSRDEDYSLPLVGELAERSL